MVRSRAGRTSEEAIGTLEGRRISVFGTATDRFSRRQLVAWRPQS